MKPIDDLNELSYRVIGCIYSVYNQVGFGHREIIYQRALKEELLSQKIIFQKEKYIPIYFREKIVSRYYIDFLIEDSLVLEVKVGNKIYDSHIKQVLAYLKSNNLKLGLIGLISPESVIIKRVIN